MTPHPQLCFTGTRPRLASIDPAGKPASLGKKTADLARIEALSGEIRTLQERLFAGASRSVLIVLQGMDTSGKDGAVRSLFTQINPQGSRVVSFKAPTPEERAHDFLWRIHRQAPGAGEVVIFNRSHYEDVLITRVKGWIDTPEAERRFAHIRQFEQLLMDRGTVLLKCFLHISRAEQKERLEERLADPAKHWKFDPADLIERKAWDDYQQAYADAIAATGTPEAPWHIIPADSKTHRNLMLGELLLDTLQSLQLPAPQANPALAGLRVD